MGMGKVTVMSQGRRRHRVPFLLLVTSAVTLLAPAGLLAAPTDTSGSISVPKFSSQSSCYSGCSNPPENNKLKSYRVANTYKYTYETELVTSVYNSSDDDSRIKVTADVDFYVNGTCRGQILLTLSNTKVSISGGGPLRNIVEASSKLDGSRIRFAYPDGSIQGVCTDPADPTWSVNIKRGIASMFQHKPPETESVMETDVSGICPTSYRQEGLKLIYTKTKDLNSCTQRDGGTWVLQGTPYVDSSATNDTTVPLLDSYQTCKQTIGSGILKLVTCSETHKLTAVPEDKGEAITTVTSTLTHITTVSESPPPTEGKVNVPSSILFDHSKQTGGGGNLARQAAQLAIGELCSRTDATPLFPRVVNALRRAIRLANFEDILILHAEIVSNQDCSTGAETLFLDIVAKAGTSGSIAFMMKRIANGQVDEATKTTFYLYASFAPKPDAAALRECTAVLHGELDSGLVLTASAVAHRCALADKTCTKTPEHQKLVDAIGRIARESCMAEEESTVSLAVAALQALGNIDRLSELAVGSIRDCLKSSARIKMSALQAFRRHCHPRLKTEAFKILKNWRVSSDLRIQGYLAYVRCMESDDVDKIQGIIEAERSNQVGSFITSHVKNTRENHSPTNALKEHFQRLVLPSDKFPVDRMKFSSNFQFSADLPSNTAIAAGTNVIFAANRYIPCWLGVDGTALLRGKAYEAEVEIGLEDLRIEHLVEKYFGPVGTLKKGNSNNNSSTGSGSSRRRRSVEPVDRTAIEKKLDEETAIGNRYGSTGHGDIIIRLLGTTVMTRSFTLDTLWETVRSMDVLPKWNQYGDDVTVTKALTWLDDDYRVSTGAGIPINLELEGTTTLALTMKGKFPSFFKSNKDSRFDFFPSTATVWRGKLSAGDSGMEAGVQVEASAQAAAGFALRVNHEPGKFEVNLTLPQGNTAVFNMGMGTQVVWLEREDLTLKQTPIRYKHNATKSLEPICFRSNRVGLQMCTTVLFPTPGSVAFPMNGDTTMLLELRKTEDAMEGYRLKVETTFDNSTENTLFVEFSTPGSTTDRTVVANGRYLKGSSPKIDLDLSISGSHYRLEFQKFGETTKKGHEVKYVHDTSSFWAAAWVQITNSSTDNSTIYEPLVAFDFPRSNGTVLEGKIVCDHYKQLELDLHFFSGLGSGLKTSVTGNLRRDAKDGLNTEYVFNNLLLDSGFYGKLLLDGSAELKELRKFLDLKATYGLEAENVLVIKAEHSHRTLVSEKILFYLSSSSKSLVIDVSYDKNQTVNGTVTGFKFERTLNNETFLVRQSSIYNVQSRKLFDIQNLIRVTYPKCELDLELHANARSVIGDQLGDLYLRLGSDVLALVKYNTTGNDTSSYDFNANMKYHDQSIAFSEVARHIKEYDWTYVTAVTAVTDGNSSNPVTFHAVTDLRLKNDVDEMHTKIDSTITSSWLQEAITWSSNVHSTNTVYYSRLDLGRPSGQVVQLTSDYRLATTTTPSNFTSSAYLAHYVEARLEKIHACSTPLNATNIRFDAIVIPNGRRIAIGSDLRREVNTLMYSGSADWNVGADNVTDSVTFNSVTARTVNSYWSIFNTSNTMVIMGVSRGVSYVGKSSADFYNGENSGLLTYTNPDGKPSVTYIVNSNENSAKVKSSALGIHLNIADRESYRFNTSYRAFNLNVSDFVFELTSGLVLTCNDTDLVHVHTEVKSLLTNRRTLLALIDVHGDSVANPLNLGYNMVIQKGSVSSNGSIDYGKKTGSSEFSLQYDWLSPKKRYEMTYRLVTPLTNYSSFEATYKLGYIYTAFNNCDYSSSGTLSLNGQTPSTFDASMSFLDTVLIGNFHLAPSGTQVIGSSLKGTIGHDHLTVKSYLGLGNSMEADLRLDVSRNLNFLNVFANLTTPYEGYETMEFKIIHKNLFPSGQGFVKSIIQGTLPNNSLTFTTLFNESPSKHGFVVSLSDKTGVNKVKYFLSGLDTSNYTLDAYLGWCGDQYVSTSGKFFRTDSNFDGNLTVSSNWFNMDNWNVQILRSDQNGGSLLSFYTFVAEDEQGSIVLEYMTKYDDTVDKCHVNGTVAVKLGTRIDTAIAFFFDNVNYTLQRDQEDGRGMTLTMQLTSAEYPVKWIIGGKRTNEERVFETHFCPTEDCTTVDIRHRTLRRHGVAEGYLFTTSYFSQVNNSEGIFEQEGKRFEVRSSTAEADEDSRTGRELSILIKSITEGRTLFDGLVFKNLGTYNVDSAYEYSVKVVTSDGETDHDEELPLKFKYFYNKHHNEPETTGVKICLPKRDLAFIYTLDNTTVKEERVFEMWLDHYRNPDDKLTLSYAFHKKIDSYTVTMKHPTLPKDLVVTSEFKRNSAGYLYFFRTTFDTFKTGNEKLNVLFKITEGDLGSLWYNYSVDLSLEGLVAMRTHGDIQRGNGVYLTRIFHGYKNSVGHMTKYKFEIDFEPNRRLLTMLGPDGGHFWYKSIYSPNTLDGYKVTREIYLPGMEDSLVLEKIVSGLILPYRQFNLYNPVSGNVNYTAWAGFKSLLQYSAGVYSNNAVGRDGVFADLTVALNSPRLLFVKSTWDTNSTKECLNHTVDHLKLISDSIWETQNASASKIVEDANYIRSVIKEALPNFRPLVDFYMDQQDDIQDSLYEAPIFNPYIRIYTEFLLDCFGTDWEELRAHMGKFWSCVGSMIQSVFRVVKDISAFAGCVIEDVPELFVGAYNTFAGWAGYLVSSYNAMLSYVYGLDWNFNFSFKDCLDFLCDNGKGIGIFVKGIIFETLDSLSSIWTKVNSKLGFVLEYNWVQKYVSYFSAKYEHVAASVITITKGKLESMKESVLSLVPDSGQDLMLSLIEFVVKKSNGGVINEDKIRKKLTKKFNVFFDDMKSKVFTVGNSLFTARIPLPFAVDSLKSANFSMSSPWSQATAWYYRQHWSWSWSWSSLLDLYTQVKTPRVELDGILPIPKTVLAQLIGSKVWKTFDNTFYNFTGCGQYLLAADFEDRNFTMVVDYSESTGTLVRKSIIVTNHLDDVTIKSDYTVLINGQVISSFPVTVGQMTVDKDNDTVTVRGEAGFSVACSIAYDVCDFQISGFYLGKTDGMLGTCTNEQFDDLSSPSGTIVDTVKKMADGWQIGTQCQELSSMTPMSSVSSTVGSTCATAFTSSSSALRPCFAFIKSSEYQTVCENLSQLGFDLDRAVCTAAKAYQDSCQDLAPVHDYDRCVSS